VQRYTDNVINQNGSPVIGASVLVLDHTTQAIATLYSDDGVTTTANPAITNRLGQFWFYAADGRYDMQISGGGATALTVADVLLEDPQDGSDAVFNDVTINGVLTLTSPVTETNGGTGETTYTDGQLLIGNTAGGLTKATLTAGSGVSVTNGNGAITVANTAPDQTVAIAAGTGITVAGAYPSFTVTNAAPDQTVSLTQGGTVTVAGAYPNFTITGADQYVGTVTSVDASGGTTGLSFSGGPVTGSGTLTLSGTLAAANGGTGTTNGVNGGTF